MAPCLGETRNRVDLRENWTLQSSCKVNAPAEVLSTTRFSPDNWYKATVPSTVLAAQVADGEFKDIYYADNLRKLPGMGGHSRPVYGSNGPLWSLCNEFWYYLAFPLLVFLFAKGCLWWVRMVCGLGLVAWVWFVGSNIVFLGIPWLMGVLVVYLPPFPARGPWMRGIATGSALMLFAVGLPVAARTHHFGWIADALLGLIVTFLIWVTLHCATAPLPATYVKIAHRFSHSSYTLYLVHFPILVFFIACLHLTRAVPNCHLFLLSMGLLAAIFLYAQLVYELFEKHTDQVRNWIKPYVMRRVPHP